MTVIYQITDTHVPLQDEHPVKNNFVILMDYIRQNPADLLVITGDLPGEDGSKEIYEWMKARLPPDQKTFVIPGNHDDAGNLYEVFGEKICVNPDFFHTMALDDIDLVFTNTGSGRFPLDQLELLENESIRDQSVVFTHYPTKKISNGFMDTNYPLQNIPKADSVLKRSKIAHVFCGHFHTEYEVIDGYVLHVTPSPAFEVDLNQVELQRSPGRIPLRKIEIEGTSTRSKVIYLDD